MLVNVLSRRADDTTVVALRKRVEEAAHVTWSGDTCGGMKRSRRHLRLWGREVTLIQRL